MDPPSDTCLVLSLGLMRADCTKHTALSQKNQVSAWTES